MGKKLEGMTVGRGGAFRDIVLCSVDFMRFCMKGGGREEAWSCLHESV